MSNKITLKSIVLASSNTGKLREFRQLLAHKNLTVLPQSDFQIPDADETGLTFVENALIKARHASQLSGLPALADDSGLVIPALDGAPGIYSARYAGLERDNQRNIQKVLDNLSGLTGQQREAHFHCTLVLIKSPNDPDPIVAQGRLNGSITDTPSGSGGFGYDPIFYIEAKSKTAAELSSEVKNRISHRAKALQRLFEQI